MIISYVNTNVGSDQYNKQLEFFDEISKYFFVDIDKDFKIVTERNPIIIKDLILYYKPLLFITNSIKDFPFSPTEISELIIFMLKRNCTFQSYAESIDYKQNNIDSVYDTVLKCFK